jgi:ketosteroid isomerase-like protein
MYLPLSLPRGRAIESSSVSQVFQEDVDRLRGAYRAFNEGGVEAFLERLAPEFQVSDRESSPDRETRHGKEGIKDLFASYMEAFDALRLEPEEFIDAGDQIVVCLRQRVRGKGSGAEVTGRIAHAWTLRGPEVLRLRIFGDKQTALETLRAERDLPGQASEG